MDLYKVIRTINDFPVEGVKFRDITPILLDPEAFNHSISEMEKVLSQYDFDVILGLESRGFIFGTPLAIKMQKGFVPIRKAGKLPYETIRQEYTLEYGTATIEMHVDALKPGQNVVIVDDLLATGGTCQATIELVKSVGANVVTVVFLIELEGLDGRKNLSDVPIYSIMQY